jgi:glyoxylase-like metal-dependent hydrolase (beta-lactamase superfamily II)
VDPAQVDLILITHFHFDHMGGLVKGDGTRAFPKAVVRVSQAEHDFWLSEPSKLPDRLKQNLPALKAALAPYQAAGAYRPFGPGEDLGKGIRALPAYGHTSGHTVYAFGSEGKELWCIGDLIHLEAIQFERPSVAMVYDTDSEKAVVTRKDLFRRAAESHVILGGAHLTFPGLVQLQMKGEGFVATPPQ